MKKSLKIKEQVSKLVEGQMFTTPASWPSDAPPYYSREGWELEKKIAYERIKQELLTSKKQ
jgi:hypothetical protein